MNKCVFLGRLVKDPDVRYTQGGTCITRITIAVNRPRRKDQQQETDFINVVYWGKPAETVGNYFGKGERILVEGRLQIRSYEAKDGSKRWASEIVGTNFPEFIETKASKDARHTGGNNGGGGNFDRFGSPVPSYDEEPIF